MKQRHGWLLGLLVLAMVLAACGPDMATPTAAPEQGSGGEESQATAPVEGEEPAVPPAVNYPVDPDDWHVLGEPDAPVTMIEYSDFQ